MQSLTRLFAVLILFTNLATETLAQHAEAPSYRWDGDALLLRGDWLFFKERFLSPMELKSWESLPHELVSLPRALPQSPDHALTPTWGTLMIRLEQLDLAQDDLAFTIRANTAIHVQLFNPEQQQEFHSVLKVGTVAGSPELSIPENVSRLGIMREELLHREVYLLIHISGWHFDNARVWGVPKISRLSTAKRYQDWTLFIDTINLGTLLMMALYFFSFSLRKNHDPAAFWLACLSSFTAMRLVLTSGSLLSFAEITPSVLTYSLLRKLEYSTMPALGFTGLLFVVRCFGASKLLRFMKIDACLAFALFVLCLITPAPSLRSILLLMNSYLIVHFITGLWISFTSVRINTAATIAFTIGLLVNFLTALHDIAASWGLTWTSGYFFSPIGVSVLIFSQGQILAINFDKAYTTAARLSKDLQKEVERQTAEVKTIMNTIPQGIMTIDRFGRIQTGASSQLKLILKVGEIEGQMWWSVLLADTSLTEDQKQTAKDAARIMLGEHLMNYDMNQHNLPRELLIISGPRAGQYIELTWSPLTSKDNMVNNILITITDSTDKKLKEAVAERKEIEITIIRELAVISAERFQSFRDSAENAIAEMEESINSQDVFDSNVLRRVYLNAHTLKGLSRALGFLLLSNALHALEGMLDALRNDSNHLAQLELEDKFQSVVSSYRDYVVINDNILGRQKIDETKISAPKAVLEQCGQYLSLVASESKDQHLQSIVSGLALDLARLTHIDLSELLRESASDLSKISRDLNKLQPRVQLDGAPVFITRIAAQALRKSLVHILRNSMDHGIESSAERLAKGKDSVGSVKISWVEEDLGVVIEIKDDGQGLDLEALKIKGLAQDLLTEEEAQDPANIIELMFRANFSTVRHVTQFSGRGVGMNAVRSYLEDIGGHIEAKQLNPDQRQDRAPFCLRMTIGKEHIYTAL